MNESTHPNVSTTPQPAQPSLPPMTRQEATFHASVAGVRAAKEAGATGTDPAHAAALGTAAAGGREIAGLRLPLPCAYSALAIPAISALLDQHAREVTGLQGDCLFIAAFAEPERVYRLACIDRGESSAEALVALADEMALRLMHRESIDAARDWCMEAFARLNGVKKPSSPEPAPPASPPLNPSPGVPEIPAPGNASETRSCDGSPLPSMTGAAPAGSPVSSMP